MGGTFYSSTNRDYRSVSKGYNTVTTATLDSVFTQQKEGKAHKEMLPSNMKLFRESRDSENHPNTLAIQLYLDVTGSMMNIPVEMISSGLPKLMSNLIQHGIPDAALIFGAIGDHETDGFPLQLGQFESGDAELDMWLERTYLEKGGGGNAGESYLLAWFNSINFIKTDTKDKRGKKGYLFTIGDEPTLMNIPKSALKEVYGDNLQQCNNSYSAEELYNEASKDNHVFHIHINHSRRRLPSNLKQIMGDNCLELHDHTQIADLIVNTILENEKLSTNIVNQQETLTEKEEVKITL